VRWGHTAGRPSPPGKGPNVELSATVRRT
jgi:hypothetical protein